MILRSLISPQTVEIAVAADADPVLWERAMGDAINQFNNVHGTIRFDAAKSEIDRLTGAGVIKNGVFNLIRVAEV